MGFDTEIGKTELDTLRTQINAQPHLYVGQEYVHLSTTPSLIEGKLEPRRAILRSFLFREKDGYAVMPGRLTRCAGEKGELTISIQDGGISKDTWVVAPEPEPHISLWQQRTRRIQTAGISEGLSSRSAENLFWVGRYAERAEGQARLLRIVLDKAKMGKMGLETSRLGQVSPATLFTETFGEDAREVSELTYLRSMLRSLTGLTSSHPGFANKSEQSLESELLSIMLDPENSGSLVSTLQALVSAAYAVRERWSTDTWRVMNSIENLCATLEKSVPEDTGASGQILTDLVLQKAELASLNQLMIFLSALSGLNAESMTQTIGWISREKLGYRLSEEEQLILEALTQLQLSNTIDLAERSEYTTQRIGLEKLLVRLAQILIDISDVLTRTYFSHVQRPQQLTATDSL